MTDGCWTADVGRVTTDTPICLQLKYPDGCAPSLVEPLAQVRQIHSELVVGCTALVRDSVPGIQEDAVLLEAQCRALLEAPSTNEKVCLLWV